MAGYLKSLTEIIGRKPNHKWAEELTGIDAETYYVNFNYCKTVDERKEKRQRELKWMAGSRPPGESEAEESPTDIVMKMYRNVFKGVHETLL